jgi:hypothetical protein
MQASLGLSFEQSGGAAGFPRRAAFARTLGEAWRDRYRAATYGSDGSVDIDRRQGKVPIIIVR